MREICQHELPVLPWMEPKLARLPGLQAMAPAEWLIVDEAYAAQMAYREQLLAREGAGVCRLEGGSVGAAQELLALILADLAGKPGFTLRDQGVTCPDGRVVALEAAGPLQTAGRLVQEDLVLLEKRGAEHVITGAVLCFPASWSLSEKFARGLIGVHEPVEEYDSDVARRVQRIFDQIKVDRPMWRANALVYSDPDLFQPRREGARRQTDPAGPLWARVERQGLRRLPQSDVVVFSIHTYVVPLERVPEAARQALLDKRHVYGIGGAG